MKSEMVTIRTKDGIVLHGTWYEGRKDRPAVILIPGAGMNFYSGLGAFLPEIVASNGFTCLSVNHRGHDVATAPDPVNSRVIGTIYDCLEDSVFDLKAMIKFLTDRGSNKLVLAGHSQGVIKILYSLRELDPGSIAGVILVSPPPSAPDILRFLLGSKLYENGLNQARELAGEDKGDQILFCKGRGNLPYFFSARTYLNFYGPDSTANTISLLKGISCRVLAVRGQFDLPPITSELMETIKTECGNPDLCQTIDLEGANHFYVGHEEILGDIIAKWLSDLIIS